MRKLHAKLGTVLTVLLCLVLVLGVIGVAGAAENSYVLKSNGSGYVANSTAITLGPDTVVKMTFGVDYIKSENGVISGLGEGEVGFGIVDASKVNNELVNFKNDEYGFGIVYGEATNFIGGAIGEAQPVNKNLNMSKEDVLMEGKSYRVIFDNSTGELFIESESTGTGTWYLIQHVTGIKTFENGTKVYLGLFYRDGVNMVLADVKYESYLSTTGAASLELSMTIGVHYVVGTKVTTLSTKGDSFIANKTPINNTSLSDYVISLSVSDFECSDDTTITIAMSTDAPADGKIKTTTDGLSFMLHSGTGVISDVYGALEDNDAFVDVGSVFSAGNKVKAVFKPSQGVFSLLIDSTGRFVEWFRMEGLDIPTENVTFGLELTGKINATFYGFELYAPSTPDVYGKSESKLYQDQGIYGNDYGANLTYGDDGVTLETKFKNGFDPSGTVYTRQPLKVHDGEMVAIVFENLREYVPGINRLQIFGFSFIKQIADNVDDRQVYFGSRNQHFTMTYDTHDRYVYELQAVANSNEYHGYKTLGDAFNFSDIISEEEYGTSYMACYDPYDLMYYLYKKTATEPDYTLISTINLYNLDYTNDTLGWTKNPNKEEMLRLISKTDVDPDTGREYQTFYPGLHVTGGMVLKMDDLKAYVVDKDDVGVNFVHDLAKKSDDSSAAELTPKGKNLYATEDGYIYTSESIRIPDGHGLVMEYDIESANYLAGTYNIGWMITNDLTIMNKGGGVAGDEVAEATKIDNNTTVMNSMPYIDGAPNPQKYSLLHFTGSSDLTPSFADNMRSNLADTGISFRVIFYNDGRMQLQSKLASAYEWNNIEYGEAETGYEEGNELKQHPNNSIWKYKDEDVYVGIRLQATYNLDVTDEVKIYLIEDPMPYSGGVAVKGGTLEEKEGTLRFASIQIESSNDEQGTVTLSGNENIEDTGADVRSASVYVDSSVTMIATAKPGYAFEGWYVNGKKTSGNASETIKVSSDYEYVAKFVPATKVTVQNGQGRYLVEDSGYFKNDDYMRIRPVTAVNYKFAGWNISLVEIDKKAGTTMVKESYDLKLKSSNSDTNMLKPTYVNGKKVTSVWGSLNNAIVNNDVCVLAEDVLYKTISFGSFTVIDRAGFTAGDLMIKIPGLTCEYEINPETGLQEMVVERKIIVEALYDKGTNVTSIRDLAPYSNEYLKDMETTQAVGICFIVLFFVGLAMLIALKKYVSYKRDIKALLEYEFVLKENDKL